MTEIVSIDELDDIETITRKEMEPLELRSPENVCDTRHSHPDDEEVFRGHSSKKEFAVSVAWENEVLNNGPIHDHHYYVCCLAKRVGNMFIIIEKQDGSPILIAGPCWPFCMGITVPLILGVSCSIFYFVILNENVGLPRWISFVYIAIMFSTMVSLFMVACRDPGLIERITDEEAGRGGWYWNEQVGSFRPPNGLYSKECGVVIDSFDHFCPWTGTGIGRKNIAAFRAFIASLNFLCYFSIGLVAYVLIHGMADE